jgi:hypothetical protein
MIMESEIRSDGSTRKGIPLSATSDYGRGKKDFLLEITKGTFPYQHLGCFTLSVQNYGTINFCCFKPPSLCHFCDKSPINAQCIT